MRIFSISDLNSSVSNLYESSQHNIWVYNFQIQSVEDEKWDCRNSRPPSLDTLYLCSFSNKEVYMIMNNTFFQTSFDEMYSSHSLSASVWVTSCACPHLHTIWSPSLHCYVSVITRIWRNVSDLLYRIPVNFSHLPVSTVGKRTFYSRKVV